jgi:peptide/nickel transport system substrate-binding protein
VKFSDGTAYDAAAVKFNWLRHQDPALHSNKAGIASLIKSMDVIDAVTLKITLGTVNAQFPGSVTELNLIGSPKAITEQGDQYGSHPVGAGPFMLKSFVRDSKITMVRNPSYWNAPRPYVDELVFVGVTDESQRNNSLTTGEANLLYTNQVTSADELNKKGAVPTSIASNGGFNLIFNMTKPPFSDIRLRQAVVLGFDRNDYDRVINNNVVPPTNSMFAPTSPFHDPNIQQPAFNPTQAQALFNQLAAENGGPLQLTLDTYNLASTQLQAQYIQGALQKFQNVKVTIDAANTAVQTARLNQRDYQFGIFGNHFDDPDPLMVNGVMCNSNPSPMGFCDSKFDSLVAHSRQTFDVNERINDFKEMQKIIYTSLPRVYYERRNSWVFAASNVQGVALYGNAVPFFDRLWIKTR